VPRATCATRFIHHPRASYHRWGYLDVKPDEDLYGGLADVFVDE